MESAGVTLLWTCGKIKDIDLEIIFLFSLVGFLKSNGEVTLNFHGLLTFLHGRS